MEPEKSTDEGGWLKLKRSRQIPKNDARSRWHGNGTPTREAERRQLQLLHGVSGISELASRQSVDAGLSLSLLRRDDSADERGGVSSSWRSSSNATTLGDGYKMSLGINDEASKSAVNETMLLDGAPAAWYSFIIGSNSDDAVLTFLAFLIILTTISCFLLCAHKRRRARGQQPRVYIQPPPPARDRGEVEQNWQDDYRAGLEQNWQDDYRAGLEQNWQDDYRAGLDGGYHHHQQQQQQQQHSSSPSARVEETIVQITASPSHTLVSAPSPDGRFLGESQSVGTNGGGSPGGDENRGNGTPSRQQRDAIPARTPKSRGRYATLSSPGGGLTPVLARRGHGEEGEHRDVVAKRRLFDDEGAGDVDVAVTSRDGPPVSSEAAVDDRRQERMEDGGPQADNETS